jgi:hypothetical protein
MTRDARRNNDQKAERTDRDHRDDRNRTLRNEPESPSLRERFLQLDLVRSEGCPVTR